MQADVFRNVAAAADAAPTTTNRLMLALALATPTHPSSDPAQAQRLLSELLATGDALLPEEHVLALIHLKEVEQRLILDAEATRLQRANGGGHGAAQRSQRAGAPGRSRGEPPAQSRARRGTRQTRRHHQHRTIDSGTRKCRSKVKHCNPSAAARTHPVGRRRPGPAAPPEHPLAGGALRRRSRRERGRGTRGAVAVPAGSRRHGSAHGQHGRHPVAEGDPAPTARALRAAAHGARDDSRCRRSDAERRVRLPDEARRQAAAARVRRARHESVGHAEEHRRVERRDHHAQPGHGRLPAAGAHGREHRHARADHRRIGHRQGAAGARDSPREHAQGSAVRRHQLQRDGREPARVRAVRSRERRVHGRGPHAQGTIPSRARRHVVARRDRRHADAAAGEAAARAAGGTGSAGRQHRSDRESTRG